MNKNIESLHSIYYLLHFNFLAVSLLACTPRPTERFQRGKTIT